MFISHFSIKSYIYINFILLSIGTTIYELIMYLDNNKLINLYIFIIFIIRNYLLMEFVEFGTKSKPAIDDNNSIEAYKYEFHYNVFITTAVESVTHIIIKNNIFFDKPTNFDLIYLIPSSFCFEIIFDFFHYITHRILHHKYLYKYIHKKHHTFAHPITIITFYQHPLDVMITNSIPTVLALILMPIPISYYQYNLIIIYKSSIEIGGHCGKKLHPNCSFSQFICLPKLFGIELYTEDHDLHHSLNNCNYGKRFSLFDKIFGTYMHMLKNE